MNKGAYGFSNPIIIGSRIKPPFWSSARLITATTSTERVPRNTYQMGVMVFGGGGNGGGSSGGGGGGGGFAWGIVDVNPGQLLPTITVGAAAGTSSFGTLLTATGGVTATTTAGGAGGTGSFIANLREGVSATGGTGGTRGARGTRGTRALGTVEAGTGSW